MLAHEGHRRQHHVGMFHAPSGITDGLVVGPFKRIGAQVEQLRHAQGHHGVLPDVKAGGALLLENDLPATIAQAHDTTLVVPVKELLARPFGLALERRHEVVTIEMHLEGLGAGGVAGQQLRRDVRLARGG